MRPLMHIPVLAVFLLIPITPALQVAAQDKRFGIVEKTGNTLPGDVNLLNEDSVLVSFGDLITMPTLLSFVYYKCPGLCSPVMDGIAELIDKSDLELGVDYQIITISIDYNEGIDLARSKKNNYLKNIESPFAGRFWQFYVADSMAVRKLTDAAGWEFKRRGDQFVHAAATIMVSPQRMITQYFYGTFILPMHFHLAITDAKNEKTDASRLKDQKYCYNYTPALNLPFRLVITSGGIGILVLAVFLFIYLSLGSHNRKTRRYPDQHVPL
jgi:protein SCO1/2